MPSSRLALALAAFVVLVPAACSDDADEPSGAGATIESTADDPTIEAVSEASADAPIVATPADGSLFAPGDVDAGLQPWIDESTATLAAALGVVPAAVSTVSAVLVVWPDVSLGCPDPDRQYATLVTDGAVIELAADGRIYRFHAGGDTGPFLCERPITSAPQRG